MRRLLAAGLGVILVLALIAPGAAIAADLPPNDAFANAKAVPGLPFDAEVDTTAASLEPTEPNLCGGVRSVWYAFTAPAAVMLTVDAARSSFDDVKLAVYRTSALTPVFCGSGSQATLSAPAGQTVFVQATDQGSGGGLLRLTFAAYNDNFADARSVHDLPFASSVTLYPATFEAAAGERDPCGYGSTHTVWYAYAPAVTTDVVADAAGSDDPNPRLTAYFNKSGPGLTGLSNGICGTGTQVAFTAFAGRTYYFQASGSGPGGTALQLTIRAPSPDTTPPVIVDTPVDVSATTTDSSGTVVTYAAPTATDDVSGSVPVSCSPPSGTRFPVGSTTVACIASDQAGNTATSSFRVTVMLDTSDDTTPPVFTSTPADITVTTAGSVGAAIAYSVPAAVDDVSGPVSVTCAPPSQSVFPIGTTHVTCTAVDRAGNTATTGFDITVVGLPPIVVAPIVPITSYDVADAAMSGSGCWHHVYNGTVIDLGRTFDSGGACPPSGGRLAEYRGGGGTLTDGLSARTTDEAELFFVGRIDGNGHAIDPVITLHLDGMHYVTRIRIHGGEIEWNGLPGALTGATVVIGDRSAPLDTVPFGAPNEIGLQTGDLLDLGGTALAGIATSSIVLQDFRAGGSDQFPIAEVTVEGTEAPPDVTPPAVTITGAAAAYPLDARIAMKATAVDAVDGPVMPGCSLTRSGTAATLSTTCAIDVPAWSLGLGRYTFTATASDAAGNGADASTGFRVIATYPSVRNLTQAWSGKPAVASDLAAILDSAYAAEIRGQSKAEANKLSEFRAGVRAQSGKAIDTDKATLLIAFSDGL